MLYDMAKSPPPLGSPLEWVFLMVCRSREERAFLKDRAMLLSALGATEEALKVFEAYRQLLFRDIEDPPVAAEQQAADQRKQILDSWLSFGPVPLQQLLPVQTRRRS